MRIRQVRSYNDCALPQTETALVKTDAERPERQTICALVPAAQYVRMSDEQQQYSIDNQKAAIQQYADAHGALACVFSATKMIGNSALSNSVAAQRMHTL